MVAVAERYRVAQEGAGISALAYPGGRLFFVDSNAGAAGNSGVDPRHAVNTLARALALAEAGDTIVLAPGGSETITVTLPASLARLKIVCPVRNPESGYTVIGAGTLDLMTVSAADVHVEGLRFQRSAGAGSTAAGVLTTAAAHRLVVRRCAFDYTDLTSSWTNYGIELVNGIEDVLIDQCTFRDCHRGVFGNQATATYAIGLKILQSEFWVGRATAFGVHLSPAGTGTYTGILVRGCVFIEANGTGAAATEAWNGTDGTDATRGPILAGAAVDRGLVTDCRAHTALAQAFVTLHAVNAGADIEFASNSTGIGSDTTAAVDSVGVVASSALSAALSAGTKADSVGTQATSLGTQAGSLGTQATSVGTLTTSVGTQAGSLGTQATSVGTLTSSVGTQAGSLGTQATSVGTLASSVGTQATSLGTQAGSLGTQATSVGTLTTSVGTQATSVGTLASSVGTQATSLGTQAGSLGTQAGSVGTLTDSVGTLTASIGTTGSTAHSTTLAAARAIGRTVAIAGSLADTAIDNNIQSAGCRLATASGDVLIEDVVLEKDGTLLAGPTNVELTTDCTYGKTGVNNPVALTGVGNLGAQEIVSAFTDLSLKPFVLESGKKLFLHGDDLAGSSAGAVRFCVVGRALSLGGALT